MLNFNNIQIKNGIYDNLSITNDITSPYSEDVQKWTIASMFDVNFKNNLMAGNEYFSIDQLDSILVKRKKVDNEDWATISSLDISEVSDLNFSITDRFCGYGEYEYAIVPQLNETEGGYSIKELNSEFEGAFLCDADNNFKFLGNLSFDGVQQVSNVGVFEPFGRKYPTVVTNSAIDYKTLSLNGLLVSNSFYTNRTFNHEEDRLLLNNLMEVLAKHKPKIVKDSNGQIYMVSITGNKNINYLENSGTTIASVVLPLTEIGDANSSEDLGNNGFTIQAIPTPSEDIDADIFKTINNLVVMTSDNYIFTTTN